MLSHGRIVVGILALLLLGGAAYWPALRGGFVWDDFDYVAHTRNDRGLNDLAAIWFDPQATPQYYPLVHTSFWIEYHLWGLNPRGYHAVNILLHGLTAGLAWRVLRRLKVPGSWLIAAVFLLHPIHVESVAWITERKNVLSGLLTLAAMEAWLRFYGVGEPVSSNPVPGDADLSMQPLNRRWYGWGLLFFAAALLAKTVACLLPLVMLLVLAWQHCRLRWRTVAPMILPLLLGLALGRWTAYLEIHRVGAVGQDWDFSLVQRCLIAGRALWFYVGKLLWPHPLIFSYPRWRIDPHAAWQYAFPAAAVAALAMLATLGRRIGRGAIVGVLAFVGMLTPALGFFSLYPLRFSFVADHFVYLPSLALLAVLVGAAASFFHEKFGERKWLGVVVAAMLLAALGGRTFARAQVYRDNRTIWTDTIAQNPNSMIGLINMIALELESGHLAQARQYAQRTVAAWPDHPMAYFNLASVQIRQGQPEEAMASLRQAIGLYRAREPECGAAHSVLAGLLAQRGQGEEAIAHYRLALENWPGNDPAREALADLLVQRGRLAEAIPHYEALLAVKPGDAHIHFNLGVAYQQEHRLQEAAVAYQAALAFNPRHSGAKINLASLLAGGGRLPEAAELFESALAEDPNQLIGQLNAGLVLNQLGQWPRAAAHLERALALQPDQPQALQALALALANDPQATAPQRQRAIACAQRAVALAAGQDPGPLMALSLAYSAAGQRDQALASARQAAAIAEARGLPEVARQILEQVEKAK